MKPKPEKPKFIKPTAEDVESYIRMYAQKKAMPISFTADEFIDFYESNGWRVGRNKMQNWQAAVRTWFHRNKGKVVKPVLTTSEDEARKQAEIKRKQYEAEKHDKKVKVFNRLLQNKGITVTQYLGMPRAKQIEIERECDNIIANQNKSL